MSAPEPCGACGHPERDDDPIVHVADEDPNTWPDGWDIHLSHTNDPKSGFFGSEVVS